MADAIEVRAKSENLDKIVGDFEKNLKKYLDNMNKYINNINNLFSDLSKSWTGKPYDDFKNKMSSPRNNIASSIKKGEKLDEKLLEIKTILSQALEKMRQSGAK